MYVCTLFRHCPYRPFHLTSHRTPLSPHCTSTHLIYIAPPSFFKLRHTRYSRHTRHSTIASPPNTAIPAV